ncbi:multidrug ABC transporter ATP-binding protein [Vallitalea longa]|uniref:Multidrug ABC transporter ATP-binding protein n=1 Tax=Vallitalea longa TaxID=2936439 RepID=A0A9W6DG76_9FIRM|nr:ABC transporter ATP-binding protein [Vallitalea longa]GKX32011.1 multidrug ABC transporter ATP-binding protein [Vallitalea longa]
MINVDSLSMRYGDFYAVDNISFSVEKQEIFGIIGSNGAGKTSTVECIEGLRKASSGSVDVMGYNPWKEREKVNQLIGVQLQETLYQDRAKVYEICELFQSFYPNHLSYEDLLEKLGLMEKRKAFVSTLSGGQKQKLAIVLSLISNPKIVFLDELTTGLDPKTRHEMWDMILNLRQNGLTIVLVSHFMDEVEAICDRVAIMDKGKILSMGTVSDITKEYDLKQKVSFRTSLNNIEKIEKLGSEIYLKNNSDIVTLSGKGDDYLNNVITYLSENNISYTDLDVKKPGLEDVFLDLLGYTPEDDNNKE